MSGFAAPRLPWSNDPSVRKVVKCQVEPHNVYPLAILAPNQGDDLSGRPGVVLAPPSELSPILGMLPDRR